MRVFRPFGSMQHKGLVELMNHTRGASVMAEIGSAAGESARLFLFGGFSQIFCIDNWAGADGAERERVFDRTIGCAVGVIKIRDNSDVAVLQFQDTSLDFVYLDLSCHYEIVRDNIKLWLPKVKQGGYIGGHDYTWEFKGVIQAVAEQFERPDHVFQDGSWLVHLTPDRDRLVSEKVNI
jgi:hypothetical protein